MISLRHINLQNVTEPFSVSTDKQYVIKHHDHLLMVLYYLKKRLTDILFDKIEKKRCSSSISILKLIERNKNVSSKLYPEIIQDDDMQHSRKHR